MPKAMDEKRPLGIDEDHARACHNRWVENRNNVRPERKDREQTDEWNNQQCKQCLYYFRLQGPLRDGWGVCANAALPFNRSAMPEQDGCVAFEQRDSQVLTIVIATSTWSRNNLPDDEDVELPDEWYNEQCGQCVYYVPLTGELASDWGACTNAASRFDKLAMFEHDGGERYDGADAWVDQYFRDAE
jgi:hypothetical protein